MQVLRSKPSHVTFLSLFPTWQSNTPHLLATRGKKEKENNLIEGKAHLTFYFTSKE